MADKLKAEWTGLFIFFAPNIFSSIMSLKAGNLQTHVAWNGSLRETPCPGVPKQTWYGRPFISDPVSIPSWPTANPNLGLAVLILFSTAKQDYSRNRCEDKLMRPVRTPTSIDKVSVKVWNQTGVAAWPLYQYICSYPLLNTPSCHEWMSWSTEFDLFIYPEQNKEHCVTPSLALLAFRPRHCAVSYHYLCNSTAKTETTSKHWPFSVLTSN